VVAIMAGAQQIDNHFITPQVMHRVVHLHPAAVILALLAGGTMGGFFGLLMAVPTAAALKIVVGHMWSVHVLGRPIEPEPPDQQGAAIDISTDEDAADADSDDQASSESITSATPSP
jgi:predicted PurR-regulated permease PerM